MAAKSKWYILLIIFGLSCSSCVLMIISASTAQWINARAEDKSSTDLLYYEIKLGLFQGDFTSYILSSYRPRGFYRIICDFEKNKCAYSCQDTNEKRLIEFNELLEGKDLSYNCPTVADRVSTGLTNQKYELKNHKQNEFGENRTVAAENGFINCGLFISTLTFFFLTTVIALLSSIFAIINVAFNPIEVIYSVTGLYFWNGVAAFLGFLTMLCYGILYGTSLSKNIAVTDTLRNKLQYTSDGLTSLGYSYWIILVSIVLHIVNMGLIYFRAYLVNKEPPPQKIVVEKNDSTILLY